jgi:hypothetical protein
MTMRAFLAFSAAKLVFVVAAVSSAGFAHAQSTGAPRPRQEVQAEAAAANRAQRIETGDVFARRETTTMSTMSREERRSQTLEAARNGQLPPVGDANPKDLHLAASSLTREQRQAETLQALRMGQAAPFGELGVH